MKVEGVGKGWHFCWVFDNFTPPALGLVFCHPTCCVAFVFYHVTLLLCWFGLLSTCICSTISYVALLFCFFFSFLVCEGSIDFFRFFSFIFPFLLLHACVHVLWFLVVSSYFICLAFYSECFFRFRLFCSLVCCSVLFGCGESR